MITIKFKNWVVIGGLTHTASTFEIATDVAFTNILETVTDEVVYKDIYYSNITVPVGTTYYVRGMRQLTDINGVITYSPWSNAIPVTNVTDVSTLLLTSDIIIDEPIVTVDPAEVTGSATTITVTTTSYRGVGDGHVATHWVVTDDRDNIVYSSLRDTVNLTSITIDKTLIDVLSYNTLKFTAIHVSGVGVESLPGTTIVNVGTFNFTITSTMDRVIPFNNYKVKLAKIDPSIPIGIIRVTLNSTISNQELWALPVTTDITEIIIPGGILQDDSLYYLDFITSLDINKGTRKRKRLRTIKALQTDIPDVNFTYSKTFEYAYTDLLPLEQGLTSNSRYDNSILSVVSSSNTLHVVNYDSVTKTLVDNGNIISGVILPFINNPDVHVEYRPDNIILIDHYDANNVPTFSIYQYDLFTQVATLIRTITRTDESLTTGKNNTLNKVDVNTYIYLVHSLNILRTVDISTGVITDLPATPLTNNAGATLISIGSGKFMIVGGDTQNCYDYDINTQVYKNVATLGLEFINTDLKSISLINGDTLIWRFANSATATENNLYYFDNNSKQLSRLSFNLAHYVDLTAAVSTINGEIILSGIDNGSLVKYIFK